MKIGARKFSSKKKAQAYSPITKAKREYSTKKFTDPIGTAKKRAYNKLYNKTSTKISLFED